MTPRAVPEFETLVVPLGSTWVSLARDPRRVRTRRAARPSGAHAAGIRSDRPKAIQPTLISADSVLRHRRQPAVARLLRGHAARRDDALRAADADRMGALRPRALQSQCARRRPPGRARGHAARRRHRPDLHRPVAAQPAGIADRRGSEQGCGWNSGRPASLPTSAIARAATDPRRSRPTVATAPSLVDGDYVVKTLSQARNRHPSRNRDRPLPDRGRRLRQYAGAARQRRTGRRATSAARSRPCTPSSQNQGDAWTVTAAYLDRFVDEQRLLSGEKRRRKRGTGALSALHGAGRHGARRTASGAGVSTRDLPTSRPEPIARRRHRSAGPASHRARGSRVRQLEPAPRRACRRPTAPLVDQLLAHARPPAPSA